MSRVLKDKKIVIGITGGIAAYKAAELVSSLVKQGALVKTIMTKNAMEFISPLTFETLSGNPVYYDMFSVPVPGKLTTYPLQNGRMFWRLCLQQPI